MSLIQISLQGGTLAMHRSVMEKLSSGSVGVKLGEQAGAFQAVGWLETAFDGDTQHTFFGLGSDGSKAHKIQ